MTVTRFVAVVLLLTAPLLGCAGGRQAEYRAHLQAHLDREAETVYGVGSHRDVVRARIERPHRSIELMRLAPAGSRERAEQDRLNAIAASRLWPAASVDRYPRITSGSSALLFVEDDVFYGFDDRVIGVVSTVVDSAYAR